MSTGARLFLAAAGLVLAGTVSAGDPRSEWTASWDSPAHGDDVAWGLAVAPDGGVYASGWTTRPDLKEGTNALLCAYGPDGRLRWTREFGSPDSFDNWHGVAVGPDGSIWVTGASFRPRAPGREHFLAARYGSDGTLLWSDTRNGTGAQCHGIAAAIGPAGDLTVMGFAYRERARGGRSMDIWLRRSRPDGRVLWSAGYDSPSGEREEGQGLALDPAGHAYACGWEERTDRGEGLNAWLGKYDPGGKALWVRSADAGARADDVALAVAAAPGGGVFAAGWEDRPDLGQSFNIWAARIGAGGETAWKRTYDSPAHAYDYAHAIAADPLGGAVVAGYEDRPDLGQDTNGWIRRYAADGTADWTLTHDGPPHGPDIAWAVALDGAGNVYAAGGEGRTDLGEGLNIWVRKWTRPAR